MFDLSNRPRDSLTRRSLTLRVRVTWIHSLISPLTLFLYLAICSFYDPRAFTVYFHYSTCYRPRFRLITSLKNVYIQIIRRVYSRTSSRILDVDSPLQARPKHRKPPSHRNIIICLTSCRISTRLIPTPFRYYSPSNSRPALHDGRHLIADSIAILH
ncbi:hypothetical protein DFH29DRAFT_265363 [Suillus ampliporus]|nr:hypothetical protein DFH29DRAFT_265363 [Suillus ampliporus]